MKQITLAEVGLILNGENYTKVDQVEVVACLNQENAQPRGKARRPTRDFGGQVVETHPLDLGDLVRIGIDLHLALCNRREDIDDLVFDRSDCMGMHGS